MVLAGVVLAQPSRLWGAGAFEAALPPSVRAVWDLDRAYREATPTRERVSLNGLWRWQPTRPETTDVPSSGWGHFKVPGSWPGTTDYMQKDSQRVFAHPDWPERNLGRLTAAWYEREFTVPAAWNGRRVALRLEYLNSFAAVFVDGKRVGEIRFPRGELALGDACRPGATHRLSLQVVALPLQAVLRSYTDTAAVREVQGAVARRGLCGDAFLIGAPAGPRITDVRVATSVRKGELTLDTALEVVTGDGAYRLRARVSDGGGTVREFTGPEFRRRDLVDGRITVRAAWLPDRLWDLHTPGNQYDLEVALVDPAGQALDAWWKTRFGYREFWIEGRDFYLNGTRIFLSTLPLDNAQVGPALATYAAAKESLARLQSLGINFVYTHNYGCEPGAHLGFTEILRAADDVGMLVAFSQPHFSHYEWPGAAADRNNGYARHAEFYVRAAQNHPSVVAYAMSHNATGYNEDMNPDLIDGVQAVRDSWASRNAKLALRVEAIVRRLDPDRIIYHHASGNLGSMHLSNFYPNFAPVQELSDWFEHWATHGVKPVFLCEYGAPFTWDWAMYRGWYQGKREFGSAPVPWEFCLAEWNAQFFGDRAFQISEMEKRNLRWEAKQFRDGKTWRRWDYPHQLGSTDFPERDPVFAQYITDNWRAFRTWGVSANSPWEHHILFRMRPGLDRNRRVELPVDWDDLQRPGFSPDFQEARFERMDMAYERTDWIPTVAAEALRRNNGALLAYIAGKAARFTSQDHLFEPGEHFEKQLVVINNSRVSVTAECSWSLALAQPVSGEARVEVATGDQARLPLRFALPDDTAPGEYLIAARVRFDNGEVQEDQFRVQVIEPVSGLAGTPGNQSPSDPGKAGRPGPADDAKARRLGPAGGGGVGTARPTSRVAVWDPPGETATLLNDVGLRFDRVRLEDPLEGVDVFIIGKRALSVDGPGPDLSAVRTGLKVLVFEQSAEVLERRLGFRVAEYGLRHAFPRVPDHPVLAGFGPVHLRDWRGEATLSTPRLKYELNPKFNGAPTVEWCGLPVTRAWRCGCQGNVASVLIEKPACGDFLPLVDGGFSLQYSPLLEYRDGRGLILFCQMDVTGRTERDPAATRLASGLLKYVRGWEPTPRRPAWYVGDAGGRRQLERAGFSLGSYRGGTLPRGSVLVVGTGGGEAVSANAEAIAAFLREDGQLMALALTERDAEALRAFGLVFKPAEHINAWFDPPGVASPFAGIGPADVHSRDPRVVPLVVSGAAVLGDGVLAAAKQTNVTVCQLAPWQFDYAANYGLKRTFRRSAFLVTRLLGNVGVGAATPLADRFARPVGRGEPGRWLVGFYSDEPEEWDDPYRFFRW